MYADLTNFIGTMFYKFLDVFDIPFMNYSSLLNLIFSFIILCFVISFILSTGGGKK